MMARQHWCVVCDRSRPDCIRTSDMGPGIPRGWICRRCREAHERAADADRRYFEEHPDASTYQRVAITHEIARRVPPHDDAQAIVEVVQLEPGLRTRQHVGWQIPPTGQDDAYIHLAERALQGTGIAEGEIGGGHIIAISRELAEARAAQVGKPLPNTWSLVREDGREVSFFKVREGGEAPS